MSKNIKIKRKEKIIRLTYIINKKIIIILTKS